MQDKLEIDSVKGLVAFTFVLTSNELKELIRERQLREPLLQKKMALPRSTDLLLNKLDSVIKGLVKKPVS